MGRPGRACAAKAASVARMCWAGGTARIRSQPARSARSGVTAMPGSSSTPGRKASLIRRARMLSMTSASRACSVTFSPAAAALWARAVPQAPPPITPAV
ncbi:hypothetical protein D3C73_1514060 [compost metagenome]